MRSAPRSVRNAAADISGTSAAERKKSEETIRQLFPDMHRQDRSGFRQEKGRTEKKLKAFEKGQTDILIGTQIIAKGLDFKNVGLVGIVSADVSLNIPDFRSPERAFQLITQAAGRAGRGGDRGCVIIQTYSPEHYAVISRRSRITKGSTKRRSHSAGS